MADERSPLLPEPSISNSKTNLNVSISLFTGYTLVFVAAITQSSRALLLHFAEKYELFPALTSVFIGGVVFVTFSVTWMTITGLWSSLFQLPRVQLIRLACRGGLSAISVYLINISLALIPVGTQLTILALAPAVTSILAAVFLNDTITFRDAIILAANILGVTIVSQPSISHGGNVALGTFLALASVVLTSVMFILLRKMGDAVHFVLSLFSIGVSALVMSSCLMCLRENDFSDLKQIWTNSFGFAIVCVSSLMGFITQALLSRGMQVVRPGLGLVVRTFNVPVTVALGALLLGEQVSFKLFLGATLVVISIVFIGLTQYANEQTVQKTK